MRVLYICRVFTGLETPLLAGKWTPTGVPTIYKIMEALATSRHQVRFILGTRGIGRDYATAWRSDRDQVISLDGFPSELHVLAGEHRLPGWLGRLRGILTTWRHLICIWRQYRDFAPDIVYVDRAHVLPGALLARLFGARVILRVMGVYPSMWSILSGRRLAERIERWAFRAPFALAICTQDGSGGEFWMEQALSPAIPKAMMLNGIEFTAAPAAMDPLPIPSGKTVVLFIGRLEWNKGCVQFVDALLALPPSHANRIHGVIVGTGSERQLLVDRIAAAGAEDRFTLIDRLPHAQIRQIHQRADIYVSLNRLGQLSNANLEVISGGHCFVALDAQIDKKIDVGTWNLIPENAAIRIPIENEVATLTRVIAELADDPDRRKQMADEIRRAAATFIPGWQERVNQEMAMLEAVANRQPTGALHD